MIANNALKILAGITAILLFVFHVPAVGQSMTSARAARLQVVLPPLPTGWVSDRVVMNDVWKSAGASGTNTYAFGGPEDGRPYASREDAASVNYQVWFGVYLIEAGSRPLPVRRIVELTRLDQRAWLRAMGDPRPAADVTGVIHHGRRSVAGQKREVLEFAMSTHSDVGSVHTKLAASLGAPVDHEAQGRDFHPLKLHVVLAAWFDSSHEETIAVYVATPAFLQARFARAGERARLVAALRRMMSKVRIVEELR